MNYDEYELDYNEESEILSYDEILEVARRHVPRAADMPPCIECGGTTRRSGSCFVCEYCGETTGCG